MRHFIIVLLVSFLLSPNLTKAEGLAINYDELDRFVVKESKRNGLAGISYSIVTPEDVLHRYAFGMANKNKRMTTDTSVVIGSTSKAFTALSIMQLVDKDQLELEEKIETYLPTFKGIELGKIKLENLLHHTSGFPTMAGLVIVANSREKTLQETLELAKDVTLVHPIGKEFEYSNLNYIILAGIVEKVSGLAYSDYVKQYILQPLGLTQTFVSLENATNYSPGHAPWFGFAQPTKVPHYHNAIASGYMISSADDMATFLMAHMKASKLVSAETIKQLHTGVAPISFMEKASYGMGWFERELHGLKVIGHGGDIPSTGASDMYYIPEKQLGVVVVSNTHNGQFVPGSLHSITEGIIAILANQEPIMDDSQSYSSYYLIFNILVTLTILGTLGSFYFLFKRKGRGNKILLFLSIVLQLILPTGFFLSVPLLLKAPWEAAFILQPDLITTLFIFFSLLALRGMILLYFSLPLPFIKEKGDFKAKI